MANILDIRRRIRSVTNTRQITRAMKMVSAARLRKAQERALAARPYAQMLTNVLKSLVSRTEIYNSETGEPRHPLLARRPENNILLIVVTGEKGLAGAFNANILKAAHRFVSEQKAGKNIDIIAVGRKGRDFLRRRFPMAPKEAGAERAGAVQITEEYVGALTRLEFSLAGGIAEKVIERYSDGEIDSVYLVYNEFKSVIAQRLVVEEVLPIREVGARGVAMAAELSDEARDQAAQAAHAAGVSVHAADTGAIDEHAAGFGGQVDYIYEQ